ncbi:hypothetical protein ISCGN_033185 [Ixodes scapularis]
MACRSCHRFGAPATGRVSLLFNFRCLAATHASSLPYRLDSFCRPGSFETVQRSRIAKPACTRIKVARCVAVHTCQGATQIRCLAKLFFGRSLKLGCCVYKAMGIL